MKNDVHYWGSVRFYKHLILFIASSVFLLPTVGFIILLTQYLDLKHTSEGIVSEQQLQIAGLEEKLIYFEAQLKNQNGNVGSDSENINQNGNAGLDTENEYSNGDTHSGTEDQYQVSATQEKEESAGESILIIPFTVDIEDVMYILVNDSQPLPQSYQPDLVETRNGKQVHKEIKGSLEKMIDDAALEGIHLIICSAYRDYEKQAKLLENSINDYINEGYEYQDAYWKAKCYLAAVGRSEHHTGLAVDLVGKDYQTLDEGQANTKESKWLSENAHKYGFILRYPKNKEEITGILFESWHFRYVGESAACFMKEHQLCLEEFIALVHKQK